MISCVNRFNYNDIDDYSLHRGKDYRLHGGFYGNPIHGPGGIKQNPHKSIHLYKYKLVGSSLDKYFVSTAYLDSFSFKRSFPESNYHKWLTRDSLESIEVHDFEFPTNFMNYTPNYYFPIQKGWYRIVATGTNSEIKISLKEYKSERFPHKFNTVATEAPFIYRNPTISGCSRKCKRNGCGADSLKFHYPLTQEFLIFNPKSELYESSVFTLWNRDFRAYLNCNLMQCEDFEHTKIECDQKKYEKNRNKREFLILKKKEIENAQKKLIELEVNSRNLEMHKSYFQVVLWYLYRPESFEVPFNKGKYRSLKFTSNNPDYPGNYRVKFNIYEPYRFKVFKQ